MRSAFNLRSLTVAALTRSYVMDISFPVTRACRIHHGLPITHKNGTPLTWALASVG